MNFQNLVSRGHVVKIDGLREPAHAAIAAEHGADLIGFIFAPARRQVSAEVAQTCIYEAKAVNPDIMTVGVFVDASPDEMRSAIETADIDVVQLHGSESESIGKALTVPVIKVFRPQPQAQAQSVIAQIDEHLTATTPPAAFLIDGYLAGAAGGTGVRADWDLAREVCLRRPIVLAGGLTPENVGEAIRHVCPIGVDVSSGVEIDGVKNAELIAAFIREARSAFSEVRSSPEP